MKRSMIFKILFILLLSILFVSNSPAQNRNVNWDAFSINLIKAIKSDHPGLQKSAMQQIINYSDSLNVDDAVYDIAMIFRFDDNPRVSRLAMVTLSKINNEKSISYLCQNLKYVQNESTRKQCCLIINNYYASMTPAEKRNYVMLDL